MYPVSIFIGIGLVLLAEVLRQHHSLARALENRRDMPRPERYPSVTVIRPIKGLDFGAEENIRTAFEHGYRGRVQIIFVFDDASEPAFPLVKREITRRSLAGETIDARVIFSGEPPPGMTGKINAMIAGLEQAEGELVVFADSDIRPGPEALNCLVETLLASPDAGDAFVPVIVTEPCRTVGDVGYAILVNGLYSPAAALAARRNDWRLPFIMGQFMVLTRPALASMNNLEQTRGQLVDDMYMGKLLNDAGFANVVAPVGVPMISQNLPLRSFLSLYLRWITFSRSGLGGDFKRISWSRGVIFFVGVALSALAAALGYPVAALIDLAVPIAIAWSLNILHRRIGGHPIAWRHAWVGFGVFLFAPLVYLRIFLKHEVNWRGRRYRLDADSRLAAGEAVATSQLAARRRIGGDRRRTWRYIPPERERRTDAAD
jgi:ceramide glucosyltransferase